MGGSKLGSGVEKNGVSFGINSGVTFDISFELVFEKFNRENF